MYAAEDGETREFKAETKKLLDIVARSLYSDKKIFIRELVSNASDALEKMRHLQMIHGKDKDRNLEIKLTANSETNTLTIEDTGIGMTRQELIDNLGTVAKSGSEDFVKQLQSGSPTEAAQNIIGRFGVGFYSAFIVADKLEVETRGPNDDAEGLLWVSDGTGSYTIRKSDGAKAGTKITLHLKKDCSEFSSKSTLEGIIKKYSNFVSFPILMEDKRLNTIQPLWTKSKSEITKEQHTEFYRYISNAWDDPMMTLHYTTDSPISVRALLYIPQSHNEYKFGAGRLEPGVNLFSRRVLIQAKAKGILPEFLRFMKGVVDSEDLPLNLSREFAQDDALIAKVNQLLAKRVLRFLDETSKKEPETFVKFMKEFGNFIKEGICSPDCYMYKDELAGLLRFESSGVEEGKMTSLSEYISRMKPDQKGIYYLVAPSRALALASPYYETFKNQGIEVLFLYNAVIDEFVMNHLGQFEDKGLVSVESKDAEREKTDKKDDKKDEELTKTKEELKPFTEWLLKTLEKKAKEIRIAEREYSAPALIVGHQSAASVKMMRLMDPTMEGAFGKQILEINPKSPVIKKLSEIRSSDAAFAATVAEQIFDNALIAAGLMDDSRPMLSRLNTLVERALGTS